MINTNANMIIFGGTAGRDLEIHQGKGQNNDFGVVSIAQKTSWKKKGGEGFDSRTTWMTLKLNGFTLQKIVNNGGLFTGDEIVVQGYLVQRKVGDNSHTVTEIQVESVLSHTPKAVKVLARESGFNNQSQNQQQPQSFNNQANYQNQQNQGRPQIDQQQSQQRPSFNNQGQPQSNQPGNWNNDFYNQN